MSDILETMQSVADSVAKLTQQIAALSGVASTGEGSLDDMAKAAKANENPMRKLEQATKAYAAALKNTKLNIKGNKKSLEELGSEYADARKEATVYKNELTKLEKETERYSNSNRNLKSKIESVSTNLSKAGKMAGGALTSLTGINLSLGAGTDLWIKYAKSTVNVSKATRNLGRDNRDLAKQLAEGAKLAKMDRAAFTELYGTYMKTTVGAGMAADGFSKMYEALRDRAGNTETAKEQLETIITIGNKFPALGKTIQNALAGIAKKDSGGGYDEMLRQSTASAFMMSDALGLSKDQLGQMLNLNYELSDEQRTLLRLQDSQEAKEAAANDAMIGAMSKLEGPLTSINKTMEKMARWMGDSASGALALGVALGPIASIISGMWKAGTGMKALFGDIANDFKSIATHGKSVSSSLGGGGGGYGVGDAVADEAIDRSISGKKGSVPKGMKGGKGKWGSLGRGAKGVAKGAGKAALPIATAMTVHAAFSESMKAFNDPNYNPEESEYFSTRMGAKIGLNSDFVGNAFWGGERSELKTPEQLKAHRAQNPIANPSGNSGSAGAQGSSGKQKMDAKLFQLYMDQMALDTEKAMLQFNDDLHRAAATAATDQIELMNAFGFDSEKFEQLMDTKISSLAGMNRDAVKKVELETQKMQNALEIMGSDLKLDLKISKDGVIDTKALQKNQKELMAFLDSTEKLLSDQKRQLAGMNVAEGDTKGQEERKKLEEEIAKQETQRSTILSGMKTNQEQSLDTEIRKKDMILAQVEALSKQAEIFEQNNAPLARTLEMQKELAEIQGLGFGASLETQQRVIDNAAKAMDRYSEAQQNSLAGMVQELGGRRDLAELYLATADEAERKAILDEAGQGNAMQLNALANKYHESGQKAMEGQKKILELTKNIREGYLSATMEMMSGAGRFSKIIATQKIGATGLMDTVDKYSTKFGKRSLNTMALGGKQDASNSAGTTLTGQMTQTGAKFAGDFTERNRRIAFYDEQGRPNTKLGTAMANKVNLSAAMEAGKTPTGPFEKRNVFDPKMNVPGLNPMVLDTSRNVNSPGPNGPTAVIPPGQPGRLPDSISQQGLIRVVVELGSDLAASIKESIGVVSEIEQASGK